EQDPAVLPHHDSEPETDDRVRHDDQHLRRARHVPGELHAVRRQQFPEQPGPHPHRVSVPEGHRGDRPRIRLRRRRRDPRRHADDHNHASALLGNVPEGVCAMRRRTDREKYALPRGVFALIQGVFLVSLTIIILVPLVAIFIGTFQDGNAVIRNGITFDINWSELSLDNYVMLFTDSGPYFRWFFNSLVLTVVQVAGTLLVSSFVAYGFAMYDFPGKNAAFISVLLLMTVPFEMMLLPLLVLVNDFGLAVTSAVIVIPCLAAAVTIFFFRQYFLGIPKELLEAGRVDAVTQFGIFFK